MNPRGFTLIEILVVVVVLGILASVVIGQVSNAREDADRTTFIASLRTFTDAAERLHLDTGEWPENAPAGTLPAGLADYLVNPQQWTNGTPLEGQWDAAFDQYGILSAIGVDFSGPGLEKDDAYMTGIDAAIDDGDLSTGAFQKLAGKRFYYVLAD
jgi:type II secretion system protein G